MASDLSNGALALDLIRRSLKEITHLHPDVLADQDPEPLHRMRVCFRRLRSTVLQFAPVLSLPGSLCNSSMAKLGRRLGMPRDLDVLRLRLDQQLLPRIPAAEHLVLKRVIKQLRRERQLAFDDLRDTLKSRRYLSLLADLKQWLREPCFSPLGEQPLHDWLPEWKWSVLSGLLVEPGWWVTNLDAKDGLSQLHQLRKTIKRARYGLANLQDVEGAAVVPWIALLKDLQDHLGELNDLDVLERAIASLLDGDPQKLLPILCSEIAAARHTSWLCWDQQAARLRSHEGRGDVYQMLVAGLRL